MTLVQALQAAGGDFEDNVLIACGTQAALDAIVTRDAAGFQAAPLPVYTPAELLARLGPG